MKAGIASPAQLKAALDRLYAEFDRAGVVIDPIDRVRAFIDPADREVVAFCASALAFGRVASVMASIDALLRVLGPSPAAFVRRFEPSRDGAGLAGLVHRWTGGRDFTALLWILRQMLEQDGSIEGFFAAGDDRSAADIRPGLESFCARARAIDLRPRTGPCPPGRACTASSPVPPPAARASGSISSCDGWSGATASIPAGGPASRPRGWSSRSTCT